MSKYTWPVSMLEEHQVPVDILLFFQGYVEGAEDRGKEFEKLYDEHNLLKDRSAKQERYIAELEKQLNILQKTLDLMDQNKPRFIIKQSSADIVDIFNREPVILPKEADSIIPIYPYQWIPVTERLPEDASTVLAVDRDGTICTAYYVGRWHGGGDIDEDAVVHWMPLPEPPKGE